MAIRFDINTDRLAKYANQLEKLGRAALPMAVRGTLNSAAFDVKKTTMPKKSQEEFVNREKNFFKANSRVETASGYNINTMESTVGFSSLAAKKNSYAVQELEQQEQGGNIDRRSFVPTLAARGGNANNKVKAANRLSKINKIIDTRKITAKSPRQRFVIAVKEAGKGGFVLSGTTLWKIDSLNNKGQYKKTALYTFKKGRKVKVKGTHFMKEASLESGQKMERFYKENVERTIAKYTK